MPTRAVHTFFVFKDEQPRLAPLSVLPASRSSTTPRWTVPFTRNTPLRRVRLQTSESSHPMMPAVQPNLWRPVASPTSRPSSFRTSLLLSAWPSSFSPPTRDRQWLLRTRTPSTNETPCEGAPDPDRAVRSETSMPFAWTRRPSARLALPRGFHRREFVSQTPLISFCNATRPADTSAVLRSPSTLSRNFGRRLQSRTRLPGTDP